MRAVRSSRTLGSVHEYFEHGADVGVRGFGRSPSEAFAGAAGGLFHLIDADLELVRPEIEETFTVEASDLEALLVAYLNELISLFDGRRVLFSRFRVRIDEDRDRGIFRLRGEAAGERFDPARHEGVVEPKGATYTAARVARSGGRWLAQCVVDV